MMFLTIQSDSPVTLTLERFSQHIYFHMNVLNVFVVGLP